MKLSAEDLARLIEEARPAIVGAQVRSIWREGDEGYGLYLVEEQQDGPTRRAQLRISLHPQAAGLCVTEAGTVDKATLKERQRDRHPVLAKLQKHLVGARLTKVEAAPQERIALLAFDARQEDGLEELAAPILAIEVTGRRANLALIGADDEILTVHRNAHGVGGRELAVRASYALPEPREDAPPAKLSAWLTELRDDVALPLNHKVAAKLETTIEELESQSRRSQLRKAARRGLKRLESKLAKLEKELEAVGNADLLQREGELLKAYATQIARGASEAVLQDDFEDPPVERRIALDPAESVHDQAATRFKRAKKLRRGRVAIETRCGETEADRDALEELLEDIDILEEADDDELDRIERQLDKLGCLPKTSSAPKPKVQENQGPRKFVSQDGLTVLVGRSNRENDELSLKIARGNDIFLHVRGSPGSHVVIRKPRDKSVPLDTLLDAATLAVHYSKMRGNNHAEVSYTPCKYVRKPKGAKPGLVQISNEKTLRPGGDPERLQRILGTLNMKDGSP